MENITFQNELQDTARTSDIHIFELSKASKGGILRTQGKLLFFIWSLRS